MMDGGNKIEKVHGIDIERFPQVRARIDRFQIHVGGDIPKLLAQDGVRMSTSLIVCPAPATACRFQRGTSAPA